MIGITIVRDGAGKITSFTAENHGETIVCAAVSMLVLNTVNSIEVLTRDSFTCDYDENGGFLTFSLDNHVQTAGVKILLEAMYLGLASAKAEYPGEIEIKEVKQ
ncbi:MAG: ribosomal-processing cysteine protease Prp [Defluviitaleaceae bacterium]|nr:ribosomal-processing cysteine protease Prp [Defluviitaleaceae bacterium]